VAGLCVDSYQACERRANRLVSGQMSGQFTRHILYFFSVNKFYFRTLPVNLFLIGTYQLFFSEYIISMILCFCYNHTLRFHSRGSGLSVEEGIITFI
jgi:hypothetical protein